jgi:hypothetical protein
MLIADGFTLLESQDPSLHDPSLIDSQETCWLDLGVCASQALSTNLTKCEATKTIGFLKGRQ